MPLGPYAHLRGWLDRFTALPGWRETAPQMPRRRRSTARTDDGVTGCADRTAESACRFAHAVRLRHQRVGTGFSPR